MKFKKKPVVIEAITFEELVAHGRAHDPRARADGMPWSFQYGGHPITHENDGCYLITTLEGTMKMTPDDMLITGVNGEIYPCKRDIFVKTYDLADGVGGGVTEPTKTPMELTEALIDDMTFERVGTTTTTLCIVSMRGGFVVVGKSACVDPAKFSAVLGEKYAREDAMRQACEHVAFWLVLSAATGAGAQA